MFTLAQIDEIHDHLGNAETLAAYVRALKAIGVETYESYVTDGHSAYLGKDGYSVRSSPAHDKLTIADRSDRDSFLEHLSLHEQGKTSYVEMSERLAASGIEKWSVDTSRMTMIFYDKAGNAMLVEIIA